MNRIMSLTIMIGRFVQAHDVDALVSSGQISATLRTSIVEDMSKTSLYAVRRYGRLMCTHSSRSFVITDNARTCVALYRYIASMLTSTIVQADMMKQISCPCLLIWGSADKGASRDDQNEILGVTIILIIQFTTLI
jgi:hypothetical protein